MAMIVDNGKTFEHFSDVFPEIRQFIIDEMEPAERVRFTRCSKRSSKEARRSKNYIYGLKVTSQSEKDLRIYVKYDKSDEDCNLVGFIMRFQEVNGIKFQSYLNSKSQELWKEELIESKNLVQLVGEQFKSLLKTYQNRIKDVSFEGNVFEDYDFEIDSMDRLEQLTMDGSMDFAHYFSKLRKPLNILNIQVGGINNKLANFKEVYQVKRSVFTPGQAFSYEQLLRISAPHYFIHIGNLTENNIATIIRSWQNGKFKKEKVRYVWNLCWSTFDVLEMLRLLGVIHVESREMFIEIKHNKEVGKVAKLEYFNYLSRNLLIFETHQPVERF